MSIIIQRLKSKTYWAAIIGALLTGLDAQSGFFSQYCPLEYRPFIPMFWPVLMLILRELTTSALSEK
jgi:branched-subunit amino acid ABC-type transport system permease component